MGLAGPRNRRKIQNDPNNTKWSRDETTFGQKILRAQGWEPGKFLGAQNSSHSHLHSAASAAPINVFLKDDTLGLGAKPKHKQNAECTGLDVFKDLLGRLNGKSEEVIEKEREVRSGIKTNLYVERKYGLMRFVSGGLLVGDQMNELTNTTTKTPNLKEEDEEKPVLKSEDATILPTKKQKKEKSSKKRKAEDTDSIDSSDAIPEKKRKKRSKTEDSVDDPTDTREVEKSSKKKHKKSKRKENEKTESAGPEKDKKKSKKSKKGSRDEAGEIGTSTLSEDALLEKPLSKEERRARKKEKKAKKQKQLETPDSSTEAAGSTDTSTPVSLITPQESGASTPIGTGASTSQGLSARHYARSRHIASKRMAMADMAALNQIFMVKPV
ncbi:uncharacterized protein F4807DRAFT_408979 [Annulohypoxylon truncatum]|uniref:uncharacterized protein n=1 Tax=Annulohypoxylon truncatum TaxID=327061 RepID=UPI002008E6A7|nr:uncharacterized protein F4807DRAFT_408979 [Annulohypoxylon truncatum]KAI1213768.1 hypothetical protein F4807DRAFT_408979 [Annulohypoxylon truncatum]